MEDYRYILSVFEGPLDLLLHLIEKHKIEIYDIPIVEITSQYMEYLDNWNHFDIHYSSEFLVMASTLLQIKSRMLLPKAAPIVEDEEDLRDELVARLVEFKKIKSLTALIGEKADYQELSFPREEALSILGLDRYYEFDINRLYKVFVDALHSVSDDEEVEPVHEVTVEKDQYSLEDMMISLSSRLGRGETLSLRQLIRNIGNKSGVVTMFMALLELMKQQNIHIEDKDDDFFFSSLCNESSEEV